MASWRGGRDAEVRGLMWAAAVLRVGLIVYGEWQDAHMEVPYTDIDYAVFSDAARLMSQGRSPYERHTYRYSPLLALALVPNILLHRCWGKVLFSAADLVVGHLLSRTLQMRSVPGKVRMWCISLWFFNPFTFAVATRGNCESLVCAIILWLLICLMTGGLVQAAIWYGLVVHFRIYPIIYALPILLLLDDNYSLISQKKECIPSLKDEDIPADGATILNPVLNSKKDKTSDIHKSWRGLINRERITFAVVSGGVFVVLTGVCYVKYGMEFLNEALLYHLTRTDPRHNFSIYFYYIYLHHTLGFTVLERLLAFVPQMGVQLVLAIFFSKDLPFCIFAQTVAFVAFNKVITAQYFVWFFCLLPLILPSSRLRSWRKGALCMGIWTAAQLHWLAWAYLLEFQGQNVFLQLWVASLIFFGVTISVLAVLIVHHSFCPLFQEGKVSPFDRFLSHSKTD